MTLPFIQTCKYYLFLQVSANGGPQPQSTIEFSIGDANVGSVSHSGLVEALKLGAFVVGLLPGVALVLLLFYSRLDQNARFRKFVYDD